MILHIHHKAQGTDYATPWAPLRSIVRLVSGEIIWEYRRRSHDPLIIGDLPRISYANTPTIPREVLTSPMILSLR